MMLLWRNDAGVAFQRPALSGDLSLSRSSLIAPALLASRAVAKLYFYYSAMNAGKTTTLLQSAHNYRERGMRTLLLTPTIDTRVGTGVISSRIGLSAEATGFSREDDLYSLVDEAQFLSRAQVWELGDVVDRLRVPVLAYGLRTDFRGELFEGSQYLLAWADDIEEIKTICHTGKKATMVLRVDDKGRAVKEGPQVEIGGNDRYVSVSRHEYKRVLAGESTLQPQQTSLKF